MSRFANRKVLLNRTNLYKPLFEKRLKNNIVHYGLSRNNPITNEQRSILQPSSLTHIWHVNDKLWKLAAEHYKNPTLWWVIASYNEKPTDAHFSVGDVVYVPFPLDVIMEFLG